MQIYPVGGGKGGIGKSLIAASLGTLLARQGKKVLLMDLDLGSANLHSLLGLKDPVQGLESYLDKSLDSLQKAVAPTQIPNLFFISARNCAPDTANLYTAQKQKIIRNLGQLDFDYLFLDLGAGTHVNMLDFFLASDQGICVLTAEPTAVESTFSFLKAVYFRVVQRALKLSAFKRITEGLDLTGSQINQAFRIIQAIGEKDPEKGALLKETLAAFSFNLVINQQRAQDDPALGSKIEAICRRHFHSRFRFLGSVSFDDKVQEAVRARQNFISSYAFTRAASDLSRISRALMQGPPVPS